MSDRKSLFLLIFGILVFIVGGGGFLFKVIEFAATLTRGEVENFAVVPLATYLLMVIGFFLLLLWAFVTGQFRDLEAPKYRILEIERELEQ